MQNLLKGFWRRNIDDMLFFFRVRIQQFATRLEGFFFYLSDTTLGLQPYSNNLVGSIRMLAKREREH